MKIVFVEPHLELFGGIRRIIELANHLNERGQEVTIYHPMGTPCAWMRCAAEIQPTHMLADLEHDVVIYNDPNPLDLDAVRRATARLKVFYILELYETSLLSGFHPSLFLPKNRRTLLVKRSLRSDHLKLSNATWMQRWIKERMGIEAVLLLGGVNREMFHPVAVPRDPDVVRVLCSGDPRPWRGTPVIEEALRIAREEEPRLVLASYHGAGIPQERMAETYCVADLFVEASSRGGWNNPVAEAMACGVPVVCTEIGAVEDFAFHEETALLVPPGDARATAAAILRLVRDATLARRLCGNALRRIAAFDWDESAGRLVEILREHLEEGHDE